jgi:hypothetical protein
MSESITLTPEELVSLTGYKQAAKQLAELHRRGFHRAHIGRTGGVVLERDHYRAVCQGAIERARPKVRPILRATGHA